MKKALEKQPGPSLDRGKHMHGLNFSLWTAILLYVNMKVETILSKTCMMIILSLGFGVDYEWMSMEDALNEAAET
jgi:hypothetical protein